jgi:cell division protein FtsB
MKFSINIILFLAMGLAISSQVSAQSTSAAQRVEDLRSQLRETQAKEAKLEARVRQLDEDIKPENIERSLAGIGSTRPEQLREQRRRQLSIERDGVRAQLKLLATSRERLEMAIRTAEGMAYQQSAEVTTPPVSQALIAQNTPGPRWLGAMAAVAITIAGLLFAIVFVRRRSRSSSR